MTDQKKRVVPGDESADPKERSMVESVASVAAPATAHELGDAWVIVELAPDAVLVVDERGHIELANRAAEVMFGYDRAALALVGVDALVPDGRREAHRGHRAAFDASPQTRQMGPDLDLWARRADGSEFPVEISLSPVTFGHGPRMVAIVRNVTSHRASEQVTRDRLLLADHERIGAGLRHGVIKRLFTAGLNIQAVVNRLEPDVAQRLLDVVDELDLVIREIRDTVLLPPSEPDRPAA
jgi:PAS domain S-box-containing protein